jgi:hypothetical protein
MDSELEVFPKPNAIPEISNEIGLTTAVQSHICSVMVVVILLSY